MNTTQAGKCSLKAMHVQKANLTMNANNKHLPHSNAHLWTVTFPRIFEREKKLDSHLLE